MTYAITAESPGANGPTSNVTVPVPIPERDEGGMTRKAGPPGCSVKEVTMRDGEEEFAPLLCVCCAYPIPASKNRATTMIEEKAAALVINSF